MSALSPSDIDTDTLCAAASRLTTSDPIDAWRTLAHIHCPAAKNLARSALDALDSDAHGAELTGLHRAAVVAAAVHSAAGSSLPPNVLSSIVAKVVDLQRADGTFSSSDDDDDTPTLDSTAAALSALAAVRSIDPSSDDDVEQFAAVGEKASDLFEKVAAIVQTDGDIAAVADILEASAALARTGVRMAIGAVSVA